MKLYVMSEVSYLALTSISKMMQNRLEKHCTQVDIEQLQKAHDDLSRRPSNIHLEVFMIEAEHLSDTLRDIWGTD